MTCYLRVVHRSGRRPYFSLSRGREFRGSRDSYLYQNDELNYRIDFKCFVGLEFSYFNLEIISQPPLRMLTHTNPELKYTETESTFGGRIKYKFVQEICCTLV